MKSTDLVQLKLLITISEIMSARARFLTRNENNVFTVLL